MEQRLQPDATSVVKIEPPGEPSRPGERQPAASGRVQHLDALTRQAQSARLLLEPLLRNDTRLFTCGGDCGVELIPVSLANLRWPGLTLVWFDAHADLNSAATSPSGHFHGMPVRALLGEAPPPLAPLLFSRLQPSQVVYVGTRDLDPPERAFIDEHGMALLAPSPAETLPQRLAVALRGCPAAHIPLDLDVLDPTSFPCTCCPTAGGITLPTLRASLEAVRQAASQVVGCGLTECCGDPTSHAAQLAECVDALAHTLEV